MTGPLHALRAPLTLTSQTNDFSIVDGSHLTIYYYVHLNHKNMELLIFCLNKILNMEIDDLILSKENFIDFKIELFLDVSFLFLCDYDVDLKQSYWGMPAFRDSWSSIFGGNNDFRINLLLKFIK